MKWLFLRSEPLQGRCYAAESARVAARWCLPGPRVSGRCLAGKPGECPSLSCWCKRWAERWAPVGSAHSFHRLRSPCQPAAPAAGLQPLSERDLIAAGTDTPLFRVAALPKSCQALGSAPAACADARYPRAGTHTALQGEMQSGLLYSLHTPQKTDISQLSSALEVPLGRFFW